MLIGENLFQQQNGVFVQPDSDRLADLINNDITKLRVMEIAEITHFYSCEFLEDTLRKVKLMPDIDRFIGIVKTHWKIDVFNHRDLVAKYDPSKRTYVPYVPDFEQRIDSIREKIATNRELKMQLEQQWEEWEVERHSSSTRTDAPLFHPTTPVVQVEVVKRISELDINVQGILHITNDEDFAELVDISQNEIWPWLHNDNPKKCRPKKDANVVRFAFRYFGIVDEDCSVKNFVLLFNAMVPQANLIDDTVSSRIDANMKSKDFHEYKGLPDYDPLKKDTEQLHKMLHPVIEKLVQ